MRLSRWGLLVAMVGLVVFRLLLAFSVLLPLAILDLDVLYYVIV